MLYGRVVAVNQIFASAFCWDSEEDEPESERARGSGEQTIIFGGEVRFLEIDACMSAYFGFVNMGLLGFCEFFLM
jgi:hypothetical protein